MDDRSRAVSYMGRLLSGRKMSKNIHNLLYNSYWCDQFVRDVKSRSEKLECLVLGIKNSIGRNFFYYYFELPRQKKS